MSIQPPNQTRVYLPNRYAVRLTFYMALLALVACSQPTESVDKAIEWTAENSIVAYGTSLTAGLVDPDSSYPAFLGRKLLIDVVNRGKVGATSDWGVANIDTIYAAKPVLVLLEFGANDFLQLIEIDTAAGNIAWMIEQIQVYGAQVALLNFAHPDMYQNIRDNELFVAIFSDAALQAFANFGRAYGAMIDSLASTYDLEIEDYLYEGIAWNSAFLTNDWIHPNAAGNSIMANNVFGAFMETFEQSGMVK